MEAIASASNSWEVMAEKEGAGLTDSNMKMRIEY